MARYLNVHTAPLTVGFKTVQPGAEIDLTVEEAKFAGVQAFVADGWLTETRADARAEAEKPAPKGGDK